MNLTEAIVLGAVQGLTEFLPISSSGHLILVREFLGFRTEYDLAIDAVLQLATILAVFVYFRKDLLSLFYSVLKIFRREKQDLKEKNLLFAVTVGTLPAGIVGFLLESRMETTFRTSFLVAISLIVGSFLMIFAERFYKKRENLAVDISSIDYKKGLKIGIFQALSVIPGISRSGATISGGLFAGLSRESSARFSFILSFPIIFGSGLKKFLELSFGGVLASLSWSFLISFLVSFFIGILAIHFLIKFLKTHSLNVFVAYRLVLALGILIFL